MTGMGMATHVIAGSYDMSRQGWTMVGIFWIAVGLVPTIVGLACFKMARVPMLAVIPVAVCSLLFLLTADAWV